MKEQDLKAGSMAPTVLPLIFPLYLIVLKADASQGWVSQITGYAFLASSYYTWNHSAYRDTAESEETKGLSIVIK